MLIIYKEEEMQKRATEMQQWLPKLLADGNWKAIASITAVPKNVWSGPAADEYEQLRQRYLRKKNEEINNLPAIIRKAIDEMKKQGLILR